MASVLSYESLVHAVAGAVVRKGLGLYGVSPGMGTGDVGSESVTTGTRAKTESCCKCECEG